jgi:predicted Zn-ribbon and HTH transcriptional regulator
MLMFTCLRCGYRFRMRDNTVDDVGPERCARCGAVNWDKPKGETDATRVGSIGGGESSWSDGRFK